MGPPQHCFKPLSAPRKTPLFSRVSRKPLGLRYFGQSSKLAKFSPISLSLSLSPWTSRKPSPSDHFSISLQINDLRLDSGERFFSFNAYPAGCQSTPTSQRHPRSHRAVVPQLTLRGRTSWKSCDTVGAGRLPGTSCALAHLDWYHFPTRSRHAGRALARCRKHTVHAGLRIR